MAEALSLATADAGPRARPSALTRQRVRAAWLFLAPMLIVLTIVAAWPLLRTLWLGFTDARLGEMADARFIGFGNYLIYADGEWDGLLVDPSWWRAVGNTLRFAVVSVALETVFGFAVALVLHRSFPGRGLVRAAILVPWAIPTIVSAKIWSWLLNDQFGVINDLLLHLHLIAQPVAWTANPSTAMIAVIIADVWKTTPFMALLILAGLQMLPTDCYEAAEIDGIHPAKVFWRVTLPLVWPAVMVAVVFRGLDALRVFDIIYVLTSGSEDTQSMSVYARKYLIDFQEVGYGSAAASLLFATVAVLTLITLMLGRLRLDREGNR
jgi:trehalose/maltose transport system permease protein